MRGRYDKPLDRESAYEILQARAGAVEAAARTEADAKQRAKQTAQTGKVIESMARSVARSIGTQIGRQLSRGFLGRCLGEERRHRGGSRTAPTAGSEVYFIRPPDFSGRESSPGCR